MNSLINLTAVLAAVALSSSSIVKSPTSSGNNFELLILHNNDMHARFEQTSQVSNVCTTADREAGKCYGGFPRVAHVVKEARNAAATGQGPPVLYLNAGDTYTGTAWFTIYKWKVAAEFINALQPDAVSLGNSEFENGSEELSPFLTNIQTKILACNVILKSAENNENFQKSIVFDVKGVRVGLVGYLTPEAKILDTTGNIEYIDEVIALKEEVAKLQDQGIYIIIALGHSDINKDVEIAREVDGIDLVIAGQKNTFYWNGTSTSISNSEAITVTQQTGKQVPVIQSTAYDKYLGKLIVTFDKDGEIIQYTADPIRLDDTIAQDAEAIQIVQNYNEQVALLSNTVIGESAVVLDGDSCKVEECNLGNLITDAMMYYYAIKYQGETWTDAPVAIIHGGAIAASISPSNRPSSVTHGDLQTALPLESNVVVVTMSGTILNQVIEHSVSNFSLQNPSGQFLQYSGIRVVYDLSKESGSRVVSSMVRCWSCYVPEFYAIDDWRTYKILMPKALADGQFGYSMLVGLVTENADFDELTSTASFFDMRSPVYPEVAGRIALLNLDAVVEPEVPGSATRITCSLLFTVLLSFVIS